MSTTFGTRLRGMRSLRGHTLKQLSELSGVAIGSLSDLENDKIAPELKTVQKLASAFKLSTSEMLGEEAPAAPPEGEVLAFIDYELIDRSDINPRRTFDADALATLADSIAEHGIIQPIMLRPRPDAPGRYWIVAGERRWRAVGLLVADGRSGGSFDLPARVRPMTDREHREIALVENMHRKDVAPLEEAEGIAKLVDDYAGDTAAAAAAIGKTGKSGQRFVQIALNLVQKLAPEVKEALATSTINKEMARHLTLVDWKTQIGYLCDIKNGYVRNGKELRDRMRQRVFLASNALFGQLEYNGPVMEDPDTGAIVFTDLAQVRQLQLAAMKAKAAELRAAGYPVVKELLDDPHWCPLTYRASQEGFSRLANRNKIPAGYQRAAVLVLQHDLSVTVFDDLAKGLPAPTTAAGKKAAAKAGGDILADFPSGAKIFARRARTMALQRALFGEAGWRTLLAHFCLNLLDANMDHTPMLAIRAEHRPPDLRAVDETVAHVINEFRENLEFTTGQKLFTTLGDKDPHIRATSEGKGLILQGLYDLEDSYLLELAMALLAARAGTWHGNGVNAEPDYGDRVEVLAACKQLHLGQSADIDGAIDWPAYLEKLNGAALDTVAGHVRMPAAYEGLRGARWSEAAQKEKRAGLTAWLADRPDKAAFVPVIFRYADGDEIENLMRVEANAVRTDAAAAE